MKLFDVFKRKPDPVRKTEEYKEFPIRKFKQYTVGPFKMENEDYHLGKNGIIDNCLEDEKIYRYTYDHLRPSLSDNSNGYDVIVRENVIGIIDSETADALNTFLDDHPDHELLLIVEGGPYKIYDSIEEKLIETRENYNVRICVKYYVAEKK